MLQKLNERIQGLVAWVVISLIAVTFALFGIDYYIQSRHASVAAVEVNDQTISKQDFELSYRRIRQMRDPSQLTAASDTQLKKQILDDLIINQVSLQAARKYGFEVTANQANAAILSIPQFQEDGHFSANRYQQAITGALFTPESFQKEVRQGMLLNQQRFALIGTAFALPNEVERFIKLYMQTRDYEYITIPATRFIDKSKVTEEEINAFYKAHQNEFLSPEQVGVSYIELSMNDVRKSVSVSDAQVKEYYEANQNNYFSPAQWQVAHILISVPTGASSEMRAEAKAKADKAHQQLQTNSESFNELVKTISDDKISAAKNGMLPWITAGQSEIDKELVNLTEPNQISEPIATEHGYEILKIVDYKPAVVKPFEQVKNDIKEQLIAEKVQNEYAKALEELSDVSYQSPDSLKPAAEATGLSIQHTQPFSKAGGDTLITKNKQVINAAFSHEVLELENNSEPVQIDNNSVIVLRVDKHIPAKEKSLSEVKSVIIDRIARSKAIAQVKELGNKFLKAAKNKEELAKMKTEYDLKWQPVKSAMRESDQSPQPVNEMAFNIHKVNTMAGKLINDGNFALVKLLAIEDGQITQLDEERRESVKQQLEASYGIMDYDLYVSGLLSKAKIVHPE